MLITGGLTDPRVTYWEPAKWAAKLRATKTDDNLLLLKINMGAGHGGKSGRWERLHEVAETYAFMLTQVAVSRPVFEMALTAGPEHIDELGHVNNAVWVQWIQQVAVAHWDSVAEPAHKDAYFWVVVRHEIDYLRAAHRGRADHRADLGRRGAARARGSTATWNSSAPTGKSAFARGPNGRSSTRRRAGRSACRPKWWRRSWQQRKQQPHDPPDPLRLFPLVRRLSRAHRAQSEGRRL